MELPLNLVNQRYTGANGRESLYDISIPKNWNGKLIVFLHGYMGYKDWGCWNLVQTYFIQFEYGFLKYNVSHNGGTLDNPIDFDDLEAFSENSYVNEIIDFEAIIDKISDSFEEIPDIYLIGHSRGGSIALLQSDNGFVKKIASWAAVSDLGNRFPKGPELTAWKEDRFYFHRNGRTNQVMPHRYSQYESYQKNKTRLNVQLYCENSMTPTCVIHGDKDISVSIEDGKKIAEWLDTDINTIQNEQHTFGSAQPWQSNQLPDGLQKVCEITLDFFANIDDKNVPENEVKLTLMTELVKLAQVDKKFRESEFEFLVAVAGQLGITKHDFKKLFEEFIEFNPPKLEMNRIIQFQRLVLLMNIDREVHESEIKLIRDLGIRMGLNPSATEEVLNIMNEYPNSVVPPHILLDIFKTYNS